MELMLIFFISFCQFSTSTSAYFILVQGNISVFYIM